MKKAIFIGALVAAAAAAPAAADSKSEAYNACKGEIQNILGSDTRVSLRKIRQNRDGFDVRVRIQQPNAEARIVSCLYNDERIAFETSDKQPLKLAAVEVESNTAVN